MKIQTGPDNTDWHVLVLMDKNERDLLGIWGPYPSENAAVWASDELGLWPLDGIWEIVQCKRFPAPAAYPNIGGTGPVYRTGDGFQFGDGNTQTNSYG